MGSSHVTHRPSLHDEIRARLEVTPAGPWQAILRDDVRLTGAVFTYGWHPIADATVEPDTSTPVATFIAHARTDIEALLDEADRLRAQVDAAYRFADEMGDYCSPYGISARYADTLRQRLDDAVSTRKG